MQKGNELNRKFLVAWKRRTFKKPLVIWDPFVSVYVPSFVSLIVCIGVVCLTGEDISAFFLLVSSSFGKEMLVRIHALVLDDDVPCGLSVGCTTR